MEQIGSTQSEPTLRKITFPIEFISPYSPDECVIRLEAKRGDYSGTEVNVDLLPLDGNQQEFRVQMNNIRGRSPDFVDGELIGWLEGRTEGGTRVIITHVRMCNWNYVTGALLCIIASGLALVVLVSGFQQHLSLFPYIVVGAPIIGGIATFLYWQEAYSATLDKLMRLIEETLVYYSGQKSKRKRG